MLVGPQGAVRPGLQAVLVGLKAAVPVASGAISKKTSREDPMNPMAFQIHPASNKGKPGYRVHYTDVKNSKIINWTQVYNDLRDAERAITLAKAYSASAPVDRSRIRRAA
jgi:uncharacterized protein YegP (UPF0339 family)